MDPAPTVASGVTGSYQTFPVKEREILTVLKMKLLSVKPHLIDG
jgi:hypothetical protein